MRSKIIIPSSGIIELYDDDNMSLTYQVADIKEPQKRHADHSKTITCPGTHNNNKMFQHIFNIGIDRYFDPNKKAACLLVIDSNTVMKGYMRLRNIKIVDTKVDYEIEITGRLADLFTAMGDTYLNELPWSDLDHTYNTANQIATWSAPTGQNYLYPFIDYGYTIDDVTYNVNDFFPGLYLKEIWDRIFSYFGFQYSSTSSFFTSTLFKSLFMPFNGDRLRLTTAQIESRRFHASRATTAQSITVVGGGFYTFTDLIFNDDSTSPNQDTGSNYNTTTGVFTVPANGYYKVYANINLKASATFSAGVGNSSVYIYAYGRIIDSNNAVSAALTSNMLFQISGANAGTVYYPNPNGSGQGVQTGVIATANSIYLYAGLTLKIQLGHQRVMNGSPSVTSAGIEVQIGSVFFTQCDPEVKDGDLAIMANSIDPKLKCKDVIKSVIKMFNIYSEYDKDVPNKLIMDPRNSYYNSTIQDWTQKRDLSRELQITPMGALNAREYIYTYKDDKDWLNDLYKKETNETYGQKRLDVDNDFLTATDKEELIFSPTPLDSSSVQALNVPPVSNNDRYLSRFFILDGSGVRKPKAGNPRILYYGGVKGCKPWNYVSSVLGTTSGVTNYPYAGHLDDPINPTIDLSFDSPIKVYYDPAFNATYTDNNLFNAYWKQEMDEVTDKNSSIVTGWFKLTPYDISIVDFRNIYRFDFQNFRLNKIYDYNPLKDGFTKCEFIKIKNGVPFVPTNSKSLTGGLGATSGPAGGGLHLTRFGNNSVGNGTSLAANQVLGNSNMVAASAQRVFVSGISNIVGDGARNVSIINSSGCIVPGDLSEVTIINSSGVTASHSNQTIVNNLDIKSQRNYVRRVTSDYEVTDEDFFIEFDSSAGGTITLPSPSTEKNRGRIISVLFRATSTPFTVNPALCYFDASSTVDGIAGNNYSFSDGQTVTIMSIGAQWRTISRGELSGRYDEWTDYSGTSTFTGWSSFTRKNFYVKRIGSTVHVSFDILGTSNSTTTSITIPYTTPALPNFQTVNIKAWDSGTEVPAAFAQIPNSSSTITFYKDLTPTAWTASGSKLLIGTLIIKL